MTLAQVPTDASDDEQPVPSVDSVGGDADLDEDIDIHAAWLQEAEASIRLLRSTAEWPPQQGVMVPPAWLTEDLDSRFDEVFRNQLQLLDEGRVVWSCLVQANELLFSVGEDDHPAAIVWSDAATDLEVEQLQETARRLYVLKGETTEDPEVQHFADLLEDEIEAPLRLDVPSSLSESLPVRYTTIMVPRSHLPCGQLAVGTFPLLVLPEVTDAAMVLPLAAWPPGLVRYWEYMQEQQDLDEAERAMGTLVPVGISPLAVLAGILALTSLVVVPAPLALVVGIAAVIDIRRNPWKRGMGRAVAAVIAGVLGSVALVLFALSVT
jgi:hypothetical protein